MCRANVRVRRSIWSGPGVLLFALACERFQFRDAEVGFDLVPHRPCEASGVAGQCGSGQGVTDGGGYRRLAGLGRQPEPGAACTTRAAFSA